MNQNVYQVSRDVMRCAADLGYAKIFASQFAGDKTAVAGAIDRAATAAVKLNTTAKGMGLPPEAGSAMFKVASYLAGMRASFDRVTSEMIIENIRLPDAFTAWVLSRHPQSVIYSLMGSVAGAFSAAALWSSIPTEKKPTLTGISPVLAQHGNSMPASVRSALQGLVKWEGKRIDKEVAKEIERAIGVIETAVGR